MPLPRRRRREPLEPATGTVKILRAVGEVNPTTGEVQIGAKAYYLGLFPGGYHLTSWDERLSEVTNYDLPADLTDCTCPDQTFRPERPGGCRHLAALRALRSRGRLPDPPALPAPSPDLYPAASYKPGHSSDLPF
ncbi:MAG: hypothetical protein L0Z62_43040 [Gemmataceae bacterium]|nr:hypothetical protein [Gemmataceae bacterium]